jgi:histidinol dehydrogenase
MLARLDLRGVTDVASAVALPPDDHGPVATVRGIIDAVRARGDAALRELTERFDGCAIDNLEVPASEVRAALDAASPELRAALDYAEAEIRAYHAAQAGAPPPAFDRPGILVREMVIPVARAGCYVPGGRAVYPSTVLMTAVPARVAGVQEVILCVPPGADGRVPSPTLAAAARAGVDAVYRVGGAQAIAAMAYGTETVPPVDVIVGPGNVYVALAKREVARVVGIDGFAGPSEVVVVADGTAPPVLVAADLLAQAEHGPGGTAVLVTWDPSLGDAVDDAIDRLVADAPRRAEIAATLATGGRTVLVDDADHAMRVVNVIAPEHVELMTADPDALVPAVRNAGAVFCGRYAPAVVGDYVVGVNHVLPTARTARFASALRVDQFRKHVHVVDVDRDALVRLAPYVDALATVEGLHEHARAVALRGSVPDDRGAERTAP